jgi:hypothetical protein
MKNKVHSKLPRRREACGRRKTVGYDVRAMEGEGIKQRRGAFAQKLISFLEVLGRFP